MRRVAAIVILPILATMLLVAGCDSGDPDETPDPRDVAGRYRFTEFVFDPAGSAVQPINVLDTLDASETDLRLSSDGTFILSYEFLNGSPFFLNGEFDVSTFSVEVNGRENQGDAYARILLTPEFVLRRDPEEPDVLTAATPKTVNPSLFSNRYRGVPSLDGTLRLRLEK